MSAYGSPEIAIAGMRAEGVQDIIKISSKTAQNEIEFGTPVMGYLGDEQNAYNFLIDTAKIVWDADFVSLNSIAITVNGVSVGAVVFDTDHDTTMDALVTAVTATNITDAEGNTISLDAALDSTDANNRTLYIRGVGADLNGNVTEAVTLGASQADGTITYQSDQVLLGCAGFQHKDVSGTTPTAKYSVDEIVDVVESGVYWAQVTAPAVTYAAVNLNTTTGLFTSATGNSTGAIFQSDNITNSVTSDVLAKIQFVKPQKLNSVISWS